MFQFFSYHFLHTRMLKSRSYIPGPTPVPERVALAIAQAPLHHRGTEFSNLMQRVQKLLQMVFCTEHPVLPLASSGTGAAEAAIGNLCPSGSKAIVLTNGRFATRWSTMLHVFGVQVVEVAAEWGCAVDEEELRATLLEHPDAVCVWMVHTETSTGVRMDIARLSALVHQHSDALVCVDAVTSLGAEECRMDEWQLDVVITASQKALMTPPGLAFVAFSERAWQQAELVRTPVFYWNMREALVRLYHGTTPWTPPVTLFAGLEQALLMIQAEGMERVWERHTRLGTAMRNGLQAMGMRLFGTPPSDAVTVAYLPSAGERFRSHLAHQYNIHTAGGQEHLKEKVFRVAHMGYCDEGDVLAFLSATERALCDMGERVQIGAGVAAAQQCLYAEQTFSTKQM